MADTSEARPIPFNFKARPTTIAAVRRLQAELQVRHPTRRITMDEVLTMAVNSAQSALDKGQLNVALSFPIQK